MAIASFMQFRLARPAPGNRAADSPFFAAKQALEPAHMILETALRSVGRCLAQVDNTLDRVVFNEWMIVNLVGLQREVLHYSGPRPESAREQFADDLRPLARELVEKRHRVGKVDFAPDGDGPAFDVLITLGAGVFAILNDTRGTTSDLRRHPDWKDAETEIIRLGDMFVRDPLQL